MDQQMALSNLFQGQRFKPLNWCSSSEAISWIAIGSCLQSPDYDFEIYLGATYWPEIDPFEVMHYLKCASAIPESERDFKNHLQYLPYRMINGYKFLTNMEEAAKMLAAGHRLALDTNDQALKDHIESNANGTAGKLKSDRFEVSYVDVNHILKQLRHEEIQNGYTFLARRLEPRKEDARELHRALHEASFFLRKAVAKGEIGAYGFLGDVTLFPENITARERLPASLFDAPVTITSDGEGYLLPFLFDLDAWGECKYTPLCSNLVFDGADLMELWPAEIPPENYDIKRKRDVPSGKRANAGGRPQLHDWGAFTREITRIIALDGGHLSRLELRKKAKDWVDENFATRPDDRTIERKLDDIVDPSVYTD